MFINKNKTAISNEITVKVWKFPLSILQVLQMSGTGAVCYKEKPVSTWGIPGVIGLEYHLVTSDKFAVLEKLLL